MRYVFLAPLHRSRNRMSTGLNNAHFYTRVSLVVQTVKNLPAVWETRVDPWVGKIPWRRVWQPTPVFLPGESHGQRSLGGYSP